MDPAVPVEEVEKDNSYVDAGVDPDFHKSQFDLKVVRPPFYATPRRPAMHPELFELIALGVEHSLSPGSQLNFAIGPLVQLWRIGFSDAPVPAEAEIEAALALTHPSGIDLDEATGQVHLCRERMRIDLGALAKGCIADLLID